MAAIEHAIEMRWRWTRSGDRDMINVLHLFAPSALPTVTQSQADDAATAIGTAFQATNSLQSAIHNSTTLADVALRAAWDNTAPAFIAQVDVDGTGTGDPLPAQSAAVVTLRTALAGRSYRGRTYLGGFTEGTSGSTGRINVDTIGKIETFFDEVQVELPNEGLPGLGVLSRTLQEIHAVTAHLVRDNVWDTQRRRGRPLA